MFVWGFSQAKSARFINIISFIDIIKDKSTDEYHNFQPKTLCPKYTEYHMLSLRDHRTDRQSEGKIHNLIEK